MILSSGTELDIKIEKAILNTYRKIREWESKQKHYSTREFIGLFVNYYNLEIATHSLVNTSLFNVYRNQSLDNIMTIRINNINTYIPSGDIKSSTLFIKDQLDSITDYDFYLLWMRSVFDDPKNDKYMPYNSGNFVKGFILDYLKTHQ